MTRSQLITKLRSEGYAATVGRVRQAMINGHLQPMPRKGARGAYDFEAIHLKQLRRYLIQVRPGPRPQLEKSWPIRGENDRMQRMIRKKQRRIDRQQRLKLADAGIAWVERYLAQGAD